MILMNPTKVSGPIPQKSLNYLSKLAKILMKRMNLAWKYINGLNAWKSGLLIFAVSMLVRIAYIAAFHPYRDLARYELERTALSLATTGVFGNPYAVPTGPTAHVSPGYTLILAGLFRIFGDGTTAEIVKECLASFVTSFSLAILPAAARTLIGNVSFGTVAGLICALIPAKPLVQVDGDWETPYTALFLTLIAFLTVQLWTRKRFRWTNAVYHGVLWGLALLFASVLLPLFFLLVIVGAYYFRKHDLRRYVQFCFIETALVAAFLAPWILRNERALGAPIATRSNLGLELRISNNDEASSDQRANLLAGVYDRYHPLQNVREALEVRRLGEVAYNKDAEEQALAWIRSHPIRFCQLTLGRLKDFWLYPDPSPLKALFGDVTAVLGLLGLVFLWSREPTTVVVLTSILLVYPAPSYLIHVGVRQRYPIDWTLVLLSVVSVKFLLQARKNHRLSAAA